VTRVDPSGVADYDDELPDLVGWNETTEEYEHLDDEAG